MRPNSVYWDEMAVCGEFTNYINNYHFYYMMVRYNLNLNLKKTRNNKWHKCGRQLLLWRRGEG